MSLHDQVPSVLTHGGDSQSAFSSTLATAAEHHARQSVALGHKPSVAPDPKSKDVEYPRHVHKGYGEHMTVNSEEEHLDAIRDGWDDDPKEIVQTEKPNNGYSQAGDPPFVLGKSPHPRHMHYEEPAPPEQTEGEEE